MERGRRTLVQALDVVPAEVGEPEASAGERHADLPRVQVARNNEMKRPRTELVDDTREVAEQDAQRPPAPRSRDGIAADQRQVRPACFNPLDRALDCARAA